MRQCLTSDQGGYYTRQTTGHDQFGTKGDFITSPEISQVFGELVGIWLYTEWLAQGRKEKVQIIEVGPGRGTLMDDVLRTISSFKSFARSIEAIYMIEASDDLRKQQSKLLADTEDPVAFELGWRAPYKYIPNCTVTWCEDLRFVPKGKPIVSVLSWLLTIDQTKHRLPLSLPTSFSMPSLSTSSRTWPTPPFPLLRKQLHRTAQ